MNAEFNWWLLIVGVAGGAGLLWLILGDWSRREEEIGDAERARESAWISEAMRVEGTPVEAATAEEILRLHRVWLRETGDFDPLDDGEWAAAAEEEVAPDGPDLPADEHVPGETAAPHSGEDARFPPVAVHEHGARPPGDETRPEG